MQNDGLIILLPVYNDWKNCSQLLVSLEQILLKNELSAHVVIVDDASTLEMNLAFQLSDLANIHTIKVIELKRNLGHQRAICVGLAYIEAEMKPNAVIVMDADGEDRPEDVPVMYQRCVDEGFKRIVFAERVERSEGLPFRVGYHMYKKIFQLTVGLEINFGNFSVIPSKYLSRLLVVSELWSHYPAAVIISKLPYCLVPTQRGRRISGQSTSNFTSLVIHGLSAIAVFSETVGGRVIKALAFLGVLFCLVSLIALGFRIPSLMGWLPQSLTTPGWATTLFTFSSLFMLQLVLFSVIFIFLVLHSRKQNGIIPCRDAKIFINKVREIF